MHKKHKSIINVASEKNGIVNGEYWKELEKVRNSYIMLYFMYLCILLQCKNTTIG